MHDLDPRLETLAGLRLVNRGSRVPLLGWLLVAMIWWAPATPSWADEPAPGPVAFFDVTVRVSPDAEAETGRSVLVEGRRIVSVMNAATVRLSSAVQLVQGEPGRTLLPRYDVETYAQCLQQGAEAAEALADATEAVRHELPEAEAEAFGTLGPDAPAELILLACDPLADAACGERVVGLYTDGRWLPQEPDPGS